jgi:hypothetical protein
MHACIHNFTPVPASQRFFAPCSTTPPRHRHRRHPRSYAPCACTPSGCSSFLPSSPSLLHHHHHHHLLQRSRHPHCYLGRRPPSVSLVTCTPTAIPLISTPCGRRTARQICSRWCPCSPLDSRPATQCSRQPPWQPAWQHFRLNPRPRPHPFPSCPLKASYPPKPPLRPRIPGWLAQHHSLSSRGPRAVSRKIRDSQNDGATSPVR